MLDHLKVAKSAEFLHLSYMRQYAQWCSSEFHLLCRHDQDYKLARLHCLLWTYMLFKLT